MDALPSCIWDSSVVDPIEVNCWYYKSQTLVLWHNTTCYSACVRARVRARARTCVRACVRARSRACASSPSLCRTIRSQTLRLTAGSTPLVGSSSSTTFAPPANASATDRRLRWPPDSCAAATCSSGWRSVKSSSLRIQRKIRANTLLMFRQNWRNQITNYKKNYFIWPSLGNTQYVDKPAIMFIIIIL